MITGTFGLSQSIIEVGEANIFQSNLPLGLRDLSLRTSISARVPSKSKITVFLSFIFIPFITYKATNKFAKIQAKSPDFFIFYIVCGVIRVVNIAADNVANCVPTKAADAGNDGDGAPATATDCGIVATMVPCIVAI